MLYRNRRHLKIKRPTLISGILALCLLIAGFFGFLSLAAKIRTPFNFKQIFANPTSTSAGLNIHDLPVYGKWNYMGKVEQTFIVEIDNIPMNVKRWSDWYQSEQNAHDEVGLSWQEMEDNGWKVVADGSATNQGMIIYEKNGDLIQEIYHCRRGSPVTCQADIYVGLKENDSSEPGLR